MTATISEPASPPAHRPWYRRWYAYVAAAALAIALALALVLTLGSSGGKSGASAILTRDGYTVARVMTHDEIVKEAGDTPETKIAASMIGSEAAYGFKGDNAEVAMALTAPGKTLISALLPMIQSEATEGTKVRMDGDYLVVTGPASSFSSDNIFGDLNGASASEPSAPATTAAPETVSGKLGDTATVTGTDGNSYNIQLTAITDPARGATEFDTPKSGTRFVGLTFKVTDVSAKVSDSARNCVRLQGSDGQIYSPSYASLAGVTDFNQGELKLNSGESATGTIPFEVPNGVKVTSVKWTPDSGYADSTATWSIG